MIHLCMCIFNERNPHIVEYEKFLVLPVVFVRPLVVRPGMVFGQHFMRIVCARKTGTFRWSARQKLFDAHQPRIGKVFGFRPKQAHNAHRIAENRCVCLGEIVRLETVRTTYYVYRLWFWLWQQLFCLWLRGLSGYTLTETPFAREPGAWHTTHTHTHVFDVCTFCHDERDAK